MKWLQVAAERALPLLPCLLAIAGIAGVTAPFWATCHSIAGTWQPFGFGVFAIVAAVLVLVSFKPWKKTSAPAVARLGKAVLLVLAIGLVASLWLPMLVGALDRGAQKRTMESMRELAWVIEQQRDAAGRFPIVDGTVKDLEGALVRSTNPHRGPPELDAWGHPFLVRISAESYTIVSLGCCGEPDSPDPFSTPEAHTTEYRADMVYRDGYWWRFPDGAQR